MGDDSSQSGHSSAVTLWCSGDAPGSPQQHNFEGDWRLLSDDDKGAADGSTPVYEHSAPDGTAVFLFFVESTPAGPAPRWVIGPVPGNGVNGWAYSDSTAARPEDIVEPWHSWVKEISAWAEARLAFTAKLSGMGRDDEESGEEEGGEPGGEGGGKSEGTKKKGGKKKKGGSKGAGAGGGTKPKAADAKKPAKAQKPKGK